MFNIASYANQLDVANDPVSYSIVEEEFMFEKVLAYNYLVQLEGDHDCDCVGGYWC